MNRITLSVLAAAVAMTGAVPHANAGFWDTLKKKASAAVRAVKKSVRRGAKAIRNRARRWGRTLRRGARRWGGRLKRALRRGARRVGGALKRTLSRAAQRLLAGPAPKGPPKKGTALVVCIENGNPSPFFDRALETVAALQMRQFARRYEKSAILTNCTSRSFVNTLSRFRGLRTDVATLVHGDKFFFVTNGHESFYESKIRGLKALGLNLGVVFQLNCWGSHLNPSWIAAGAKAVTGTRKLNTRIQAFIPFFRAWTAGKTFREAVRAANTRTNLIGRISQVGVAAMKKLGAACCGTSAASRVCAKLGPAKIRAAYCRHYRYFAPDVDSTFLVAGNGNLRF